SVERVTSLRADLRWPNDLLLGRRKFCGILSEMNAEVTRIRHMVIGIGINVLQQEFPAELRDFATSMYIETGREWPRQELLGVLLKGLDHEVNSLTATDGVEYGSKSILERLEQASSWIRGKRVYVEGQDGYAGITEGLDARGFLLIRTASGLKTVYSGGVREQR
ncbi:MAG: biotin--[acetyl-CoA-carboxylase] ligase, partial [Acidobacteriaceae bacterium]|nr:biotin--[acetyl-CoA-carboxylase] ligase [Acidobacteriaceae bacterium]